MRHLRHEQMKSLPDLPAITMDDDPDVFSTYLHTLYFGAEPLKERVAAMIEENSHRQQKPSDSDSGDQGAKSDGDGAAPVAAKSQATRSDDNRILKGELVEKFLIDLHLLAVKLRDVTAADLAIDELVELYKQDRSIRKEMVAFVYHSTSSNSIRGALRALYTDLHVFRVKRHWLDGSVEETEYPFDFIRDVLRKVWNLKPRRAGREVDVPYRRELDATQYHCRHHPINTQPFASVARQDE